MRDIRIAIVEDEDRAAEKLLSYLKKYGQEHDIQFEVKRFTDGMDILEDYDGSFDIIFMDILMKHMNGMQAAERIRGMDDHTILIFLTSMTDYAIQGYRVEALSYIVKPVEYFEFACNMDRALTRLENSVKKYISILGDEGVFKMEISEIYYVEIFGHRLVYHTKRGNLNVRGTIAEVEKDLDGFFFFRIHKGCLVNLRWVSCAGNNSCEIRGECLPVSRRRYKAFSEELLAYMSRQM